MSVRSMVGGMSLGLLCLAGPAMAQDIEADEVKQRLGFNPETTEIGVNVQVGVGGLTGDLGERTSPGALLGVTAAAQPWNLLGVEVGYEGQRMAINDLRIGDEQAMVRHNLSMLAKAGPQLMDDKLRPYVGAGVGVSYLNATDGAEDTGLYSNDLVRELPLAAGLDYQLTDAISAGARASYRLMYGEEFANDAVAGDAEGNLLNFGVTVGGRF